MAYLGQYRSLFLDNVLRRITGALAFVSLNCVGLLLAASLFVGGIAPTLRAQTITTFDPPTSVYTVPQAVNIFGQITGYYLDAAGFPTHGFLRHADGTFTTFDVQLGDGLFWPTYGTDINLEGEITGYVTRISITRGFLRHTDGTIDVFDAHSSDAMQSEEPSEPAPRLDCPFDGTSAIAINAAGQITGGYVPGAFCQGYLRQADGTVTVFTVEPGSSNIIPMTFAEAINLRGQITGFYRDLGGNSGFLRQPNGSVIRFNPVGSTFTAPQSINLVGGIAGYYQLSNGVSHGFLRQPNGTIIAFDPPGSVGTQPASINVQGQITGFYNTADGISHGFLRQRNGNIESFDVPQAAGGPGTFPQGINDLGRVVGYYQGADHVLHGFVRSAH